MLDLSACACRLCAMALQIAHSHSTIQDCLFYLSVGGEFQPETQNGGHKVVFSDQNQGALLCGAVKITLSQMLCRRRWCRIVQWPVLVTVDAWRVPLVSS